MLHFYNLFHSVGASRVIELPSRHGIVAYFFVVFLARQRQCNSTSRVLMLHILMNDNPWCLEFTRTEPSTHLQSNRILTNQLRWMITWVVLLGSVAEDLVEKGQPLNYRSPLGSP